MCDSCVNTLISSLTWLVLAVTWLEKITGRYSNLILALTCLALVGTLCFIIFYWKETKRIAEQAWSLRFGISVECDKDNKMITTIKIGWHSPFPIRGIMSVEYRKAKESQFNKILENNFHFWAGFEKMTPLPFTITLDAVPDNGDIIQISLHKLVSGKQKFTGVGYKAPMEYIYESQKNWIPRP